MKYVRVPGLFFLALLFTSCQPKSPTVTLALLGDLMLGRGLDPNSNSLAILTPDLSAADLVLANLESPLAPNPPVTSSAYDLCTSSTRAKLIAAWGFDLLSIANNHKYDCGPEGPTNTRSALQAAGITSIGPGMEPVLREINNLPLAFLAFDDVSSPLDENSAVQAIHSAHASGAVVIVSIHWGMEYQGGASDRQKSLAQQFVDAGAALVWGHHPHVLQPCEGCQTSHGTRAVILYSLGNALFDQGGLSDTRQSALVMVTLNAQGVTDFRAVPFVIDVIESRVVQPNAETAAKIRTRLNLP
jgi:poly-gamma-glutamate synthesis protein (capsule biosynthesis protein)